MGQKYSYDVTKSDGKTSEIPYAADPLEKGEPTAINLVRSDVAENERQSPPTPEPPTIPIYLLERIPPPPDLPIHEYVEFKSESTVTTD